LPLPTDTVSALSYALCPKFDYYADLKTEYAKKSEAASLSRYAYDAAHYYTDTVLTVFCPYGLLPGDD
jgi:hypothetical protein